jgi:diadenosine tetraphosphate (Ap4A) HIT family hydrolase
MNVSRKEYLMLIGERFKPFVIKEYHNWGLILAENQFYVGRCYTWSLDKTPGEGECLRPSQIHPIARDEYFEITNDVVRVCKALGYEVEPYGEQFMLNEAYFANEEGHNHHLHYHMIPRTKRPFEVPLLHITMEDPQWGRNYAGRSRMLAMDQMLALVQIFRQTIG